MLVPGERADVVITATSNPGTELDILTLPYERGHGSGTLPSANVLQIRYSSEAATTTPSLPMSFRPIDALPAPVRSRQLVLAESQPAGAGGHSGHGSSASDRPSFTINGQAFPNITPLVAKLGETELWEVRSDEEIDHPFHIHGFFFQVLSRGGVPEPFRAWKDTVNIKGKQTLQLAVRFDGFDGKWLFHCHILEHSENGMTGELDVTK
jgi:FtsP/CotA-like multicopper oxidase with cupredoxin domain